MASLSFGNKQRPAGKEFRDGTVGEALDDLYSDIEEAVLALESLTGLPRVAGFSGEVDEDAGSDAGFDVIGSGFLGGSGLAEGADRTGAGAPANSEITYQAKKSGSSGNAITVQINLPTGDNATLELVEDVALKTVTINLATDATNPLPLGTSDCAAIVNLINAHAAGSALICAQAATGATVWVAAGGGADTDPVTLSGGSGEERTITLAIGTDDTTAFSSISDTELVLADAGAIPGANVTVGDVLVISAKVDDTFSNQGLQLTVVT